MGRNLLFCFLFIFLTRIGGSFRESLPRYFPSREDGIHKAQVSYPYSKTDCVCSKQTQFSFLQCEEKFLAMFSLFDPDLSSYGDLEPVLAIKCNKTAASEDLNHNFSNLFGYSKFYWLHITVLDMKECPEPSVSFARLLFPIKKENYIISNQDIKISSLEKLENRIRSLKIQCLERKKYAITKRHLENLYSLRSFNVSCFALKFLPWDLFQGTTPSLELIIIENTRLEEIPSMLFYNLTELKHVYLRNNFIKRIKGDAFLGCKSLSTLDLSKNNLAYLEENVLKTLENISRLFLSNNILREMPRNFNSLIRLTSLDISHNRLEELKKEDCDGLTQIKYLRISNNRITHINQNCFYKNVTHIDISGNALKNITENPIELNKLRYFYFSDNSISQLDVKKFFVSEGLFVINMSNSNVFSIGNETFQRFPKLEDVDLSTNKITSIPEDLFVKNDEIKNMYLQSNNISSLPSGLFRKNKKLLNLDLSRNRIRKLPKHLFSKNTSLETLNFAFNHIENIPERFLSNITSLKVLNFSNNYITSLHNRFLEEMTCLDQLDISYNSLLSIRSEIFSFQNNSINLRRLFLQGNNISDYPDFTLEKLEYLDLSRNMLKYTVDNFLNSLTLHTPSLKELYLSKNYFESMSFTAFQEAKHLLILDLSYNRISSNNQLFDIEILSQEENLSEDRNINSIDLSYNEFTYFSMDMLSFDKNLEELNLSNNNIEFIIKYDKRLNFPKLKILDISYNKLTLAEKINDFDEASLSWGLKSIFRFFPNLEELYLRNDLISHIFLELRIKMPYLKYIDLRQNKLSFLSHQDLLFKSTYFYESEGFGPYPWSHKLTIDLRHNLIRFVELPQRMLQILPQRNETKNAYGHVSMLIDDNPLECGCAVFNLLKVIRYDVVLTSQLRRVTGHTGMRPADLVVGDLSCSAPNTVKGKKINNTEEWIHHLIPLLGICTLQDIL